MSIKSKDSGKHWIGEIPIDWNIVKVKNVLCQKITDGPHETPNFIEQGVPFLSVDSIVDGKLSFNQCRYISKEDDEKYSIKCKPRFGDILLGKSASTGKIASVDTDIDFNIWSPLALLRVNKNVCNYKFLEYALKSPSTQYEIEILCTNNTQKNISMYDIGRLHIPVPTKIKQEKIAGYLDEKVHEIDDVIYKVKKTINEYKQYKQSIITETVTKGMAQNIEMKDSGIEWIGEIPKHWDTMKIKWVMRNKSVKNHPNERVLSLYRDLGIVPKDSRDDNHNVTSENTETYKLVDIGDLVINKMKAWQGSMAISGYRGIVSPAYYVCDIYNDNIYRKYLHYLLRNQLYIPEFRRLSTGMRVGQWDLNINDFMNIPIIIPSIEEQQEIVEFLDKKCVEIDKLIDKKEQLILELENYKKSLIYECVTGKKEI